MTNLVFNPRYRNPDKSLTNYRRILFNGGKGLQAEELNELQELVLGSLKSVASFMIRSGTMLSGGSITGLNTGNISIDTGRIYADGEVVLVPAASIPIAGVGVEVVGVLITKAVVTGYDDNTILDQDPESPNFGLMTADRLKYNAQWTLASNVNAAGGGLYYPVFTLKDGSISNTSSLATVADSSTSSLIQKYDSSIHGSYVLNGLDCAYSHMDSNNNPVILVSSGRARVNGVEVYSQFTQETLGNALNDLGHSNNEPFIYNGVGSYPVRYYPIQSVQQLMLVCQATENIVKGVSLGSDPVSNTPLVDIVSITQGATTYVKGVDFRVSNPVADGVGDAITWIGDEPAPGSTYSATYNFNKTVTTVANDSSNIIINDLTAVSGSTAYVTYSYYLKRVDRLSVNGDGTYKITTGAPVYKSPKAPPEDTNSLSIATIYQEHGQSPVITQDTTIVVKYSDLKGMQQDILDLKYDVAQLSLLETVRATDPSTFKKGIVVDSLKNDNQRDLGKPNNAIISDGELFIGSQFRNMATSASIVMLNSTDYESQKQLAYTDSVKINPYAVASPVRPTSSVDRPQIYGNATWPWFHGNFLPRPESIKFMGKGFMPNEQVQLTNSSIQCNVVSVADASGAITETLTVPANTQMGTYPINAKGLTSSGVTASSVTLMVNPQRAAGDWGFERVANSGLVSWGADPVSQTFTVSETQELSAVSVYITELPRNSLAIKLVRTTAGIPDKTRVLSMAEVPQSTITLGWNKLVFRSPIRLYKDIEYAIIVVTESDYGSVATAKVGHSDRLTNAFISRQTSDGVLLLSSNESTWTPVQDSDLTFKLHANQYASSLTVDILSASVSNMTDWNFVATVDQPTGTLVTFKLVHIESGDSYDLPLNDNITTDPITGTVKVVATLGTLNSSVTPIIYSGASLAYDTMDNPGYYTMRSFALPSGVNEVSVYIDQNVPANASILVEFLTKSGALVTTTPMVINPATITPIGGGFKTTEYTLSNVSGDSAEIKVTLNTSKSSARPIVKNIRVIVK